MLHPGMEEQIVLTALLCCVVQKFDAMSCSRLVYLVLVTVSLGDLAQEASKHNFKDLHMRSGCRCVSRSQQVLAGLVRSWLGRFSADTMRLKFCLKAFSGV